MDASMEYPDFDVIVWLICNAVVRGLLVVNDIINLGIDIEEEIYINS